MYVRFVAPNGTPRNAFLSIEEVKKANANGVLAAINEAFTDTQQGNWLPLVLLERLPTWAKTVVWQPF